MILKAANNYVTEARATARSQFQKLQEILDAYIKNVTHS